ncbi:dihydroorotase [Alicyclobacillus contaminans]|uniref:amidohydrolase/deacetylase family metallohydrolase n=1 Tax=Alicyclobacillus contaminans TaxID=392016 RepID=UPI0004070A36|nr:amidohydrolase/deacetylase family metallohydrolase [Alicyclobacillus contaminans]GMA48951.1 dihydroorotase [Alicyclobacillus contaminans]
MKHELIIKHGRVIDPASGLDGRFDVAIDSGRITKVESPGEIGIDAEKVLDATGCIVAPGFIDLHVHVYENDTYLGIDADQVGVRQGVTTVVDAGSSGSATFPHFLHHHISRKETEVLAWLNISEDGLCNGNTELADMSKLRPEETGRMIEDSPTIRGIKVRMSRSVVGGNGIQPLVIAKQVARERKVPVMVHIGNTPPDLADILNLLEAGDVVTHAFHGKPGGILDSQGQLIPGAGAALARGVLFDVGHGTASFSFQTMMRAKELGLKPHSISTDIYKTNYHGPVYSLTLTMSKLIQVGFSLTDVIEWVTLAPARILRLEDELGSLKPGTVADISIVRLVERPIDLMDSEGFTVRGERVLQPVYTIKNGRVFDVADK